MKKNGENVATNEEGEAGATTTFMEQVPKCIHKDFHHHSSVSSADNYFFFTSRRKNKVSITVIESKMSLSLK